VNGVDQDEWAAAFESEIDRVAALTPDRILNSVFFGGGTPSLMDVATVDRILNRIRKHWRLANDLEVTLEANPTSIEANRFAGYRAAGVNRVAARLIALVLILFMRAKTKTPLTGVLSCTKLWH